MHASLLLSASGGVRGVYTKSRDILTTILGFLIILLLFSHIVSSRSTGSQGYELSFSNFLVILSNPPDLFGRDDVFPFLFSAFRALSSMGDTFIIGPLLEAFGTIGYYLFSIVGFLLQGLNMILGVFIWALGYFCPWLVSSFV